MHACLFGHQSRTFVGGSAACEAITGRRVPVLQLPTGAGWPGAGLAGTEARGRHLPGEQIPGHRPILCLSSVEGRALRAAWILVPASSGSSWRLRWRWLLKDGALKRPMSRGQRELGGATIVGANDRDVTGLQMVTCPKEREGDVNTSVPPSWAPWSQTPSSSMEDASSDSLGLSDVHSALSRPLCLSVPRCPALTG